MSGSSPPLESTQPSADSRWGWGRLARLGLLLVGALALVYLVWSVGPEVVLATLVEAGPWFPLILLLEFAWVGFEGLALLSLYGESARRISFRTWFRTGLVHFTTLLILPVGRAGAEVARATLLSKRVGGGRAAAGAALMQSLVLVANAIVSLVCAAFVPAEGVGEKLRWLLVGNAGVTFALGGGLYLVARSARIGGFLGRTFDRLRDFGPDVDAHVVESRPRHLRSLGLALLGRSVQTVQYGVLFAAVTGAFSVRDTFVSQGIHLVGAGLGDMVPNQVGVTEGAFHFFAGALGLGATPERAIAIALLARMSIFVAAGVAALVAQLVPERSEAPSPRAEPNPAA